jgi:hypothetical protein
VRSVAWKRGNGYFTILRLLLPYKLVHSESLLFSRRLLCLTFGTPLSIEHDVKMLDDGDPGRYRESGTFLNDLEWRLHSKIEVNLRSERTIHLVRVLQKAFKLTREMGVAKKQ